MNIVPMFAVSVISLVVILIVLGAIAWFVSSLVKIPSWFKWLIYVVLGGVALFLVLDAFGILSEVRSVQVPRL